MAQYVICADDTRLASHFKMTNHFEMQLDYHTTLLLRWCCDLGHFRIMKAKSSHWGGSSTAPGPSPGLPYDLPLISASQLPISACSSPH